MVDVKMLGMIFLINFTYVTVSTIRLMLMMKGYRLLAPLLSMVEITIYVLGLSLVLDRLDNLFNLFVYALGFGVGILMGIKIEDYLALGYIMTTVILPSDSQEEKILKKTRNTCKKQCKTHNKIREYFFYPLEKRFTKKEK